MKIFEVSIEQVMLTIFEHLHEMFIVHHTTEVDQHLRNAIISKHRDIVDILKPAITLASEECPLQTENEPKKRNFLIKFCRISKMLLTQMQYVTKSPINI